MYQVISPVLFLIFNRPEQTGRVFNAIRSVKPTSLYIAADGPRPSNEYDAVNCALTRKIVSEIDWNCDVKTLFRDKNKGCGKAVSEAITWFFDSVNEGIILEDDCLPGLDFFRFCDEMLYKYRDDERVGHVSGTNVHDFTKRGVGSYYYSQLSAIWGWATWKRVWNTYDYNMQALPEAIKRDFLSNITSDKYKKKRLLGDFIMFKKGEVNTWDFQYSFAHIINNRLSVIPNHNLISNIGFVNNGTHTVNFNEEYANVKLGTLPEVIKYPALMLPDKLADDFSLSRVLPGRWRRYFSLIKSIIKL